MIVGTVSEAQRSYSALKGIQQFFEFISANNMDKLPEGKVTIDGDDVFVMNLLIDGKSAEDQPLEMHRKYIDIHVLLEGEEKIGWKPLERISDYIQSYQEEGDCALASDTPDFYVSMKPGDYCIVFPEDPHAPAISSGKIRKLIGKVRL